MANREQRSNKETKKPKKSSAPDNRPVTAATAPAPITTVIIRGPKQRQQQ